MKNIIQTKLKSVLANDYFRAIGFLFLIQFYLFYSNYTDNQVFMSNDLISASNTTTPLKEFHESTGEYPFWNPFIFGGMPSYESLSYNNLVYIPNEIFKAVRDWLGLNYLFSHLMHILMAGAFTFLFLKRRGLSQLSSLFGGVIYMMNPYLITMLVHGHGSQAYSSAYIPLVFYAISELWSKPSARNVGIAALALGFQLQSKHVQIVYYTWMLVGFFVLYSVVVDLRNKAKSSFIAKNVGIISIALILAFMIAAVLYLPVHSYSEWSTRGGGEGGGAGFRYATQWSFSPGEIMTFVIPSFYGFGGRTYWGEMPFTDYPNYMGIIALMLAIYALIRRPSKITTFLGTVAVLATVISFGRHFSLLYSALYDMLPFFNKFRVPAMILILVQFSVAALAGYGLEAVIADIRREKNKDKKQRSKNPAEKYFLYGLLSTAGVAITVLILKSSILASFLQIQKPLHNLTARQMFGLNTQRFELFYTDFWVLIIIVTAFFAILYYSAKKGLKPYILGFAIIGLTIFDLGRIDTKIIGNINTRHASFLDKSTQISLLDKYLLDKMDSGEIFRIFPVENLFSTKEFAARGIESIGGYHPAKLWVYQSYLDFTSIDRSFVNKYFKRETNSNRTVLREPSEINKRTSGLDLAAISILNVKYIVSAFPMNEPKFELIKKFEIEENEFNFPIYLYNFNEGMPRAWLVNRARVFETEKNIVGFMRMQIMDPTKEVFLSSPPDTPLDSTAVGKVEIIKYSLNQIEIAVETSGQMILVISELYYPAGWKMFMDDNPIEMKPANYILRSVEIPPGSHIIRMDSRPPAFTVGLTLTAVGYLAIAGIFIFPIVKRKLS